MGNARIHLRLLGPFAATAGAEDITGAFSHPKRLAFITWLTLSRPAGLHRRETICALLWPESSDQNARGTLRQLLLVLRRELGEQAFITQGDLLGLNPEVISSDAGAVLDALERGDDAAAVSGYSGELLPGLHLGEGETFERWFEQQRTELRRGVARAAWRLADGAEARGDIVESLDRAETAFSLDSTDEAGLRRLVSLQAKAGDRAAALRTYERFARHLKEDWGAEPAPQTVALIEEIRSGRAAATSLLAQQGDTSGMLSRPKRDQARLAQWVTRRFPAFALFLGGIAVGASVWATIARSGRQSHAGPERWSIALPDSAPLVFVGAAPFGQGVPALAVSPDGRRVVYVGRRGTGTELHVHELGSFESRPLLGTEGAFHPIFSPDGRDLAFFAGGKLKRIALAGGAPTVLADALEPQGGIWTEEDLIIFPEADGQRLTTVRATGGAPRSVRAHQVYAPTAIPGSSWVLHAVFSNSGILAATSVETGDTRYLRQSGPPSETMASPDLLYGIRPIFFDGYLIYVAPTEGRLLARGFDPRALEVTGDAFVVAEGVRVEKSGAQTSIGGHTLAYAIGGDARVGRLVWAAQGGGLDTLPIPPASFGEFDISPRGNRLILSVGTIEGPAEIHVLDLQEPSRGVLERWRPPPGVVTQQWAPDESWIAVSVNRLSSRMNYRVPVPLNVPVDSLYPGFVATDFSGDGRFIVGFLVDSSGVADLAWASVDSNTASPLSSRPGFQYFATLSPNDDWVAYMSDESGTWEVYVDRFPEMGARRKVSIGGGEEPMWSRQGDLLYYRNGQTFMIVRVDQRTGAVGTPVEFASGQFINLPGFSYDVAPDGQRLLLMLGPADETANHIRVIRDFGAELRRAAASARGK